MSKEILIKIRDKIADRISGEYVCGNSDFVAVFDFDEEWSACETKTARFYYGDEFIDKPFNGDRCEIPILSDIHSFEIGVFAGNLKTSTSAYVPARKSILCKGGSPAAPSPDVYAEIMEMLNNSKLPPEEIAAAVKKYLDENVIDHSNTLEQLLIKPHNNEGCVELMASEKDEEYALLIDSESGVTRIRGLTASPEHPTDAANKQYVDNAIPTWAKQPTKPSYSAAEIGALSANTPIPKKTSELENDAGFLTEKDLPSGGSCLDLEDFELIDTLDFSTEEMAQRSASKSYTVDNVLEVVVVWKCLQNISTSTYSSLNLGFNENGMPTHIRTAPANKNTYGYCYYKVLKNLGTMHWFSPGASSETNYAQCNGQIPYNLPTHHSEPITSITISNASNADWVVTSGTVEIYVR